jgi:hypothetical protein
VSLLCRFPFGVWASFLCRFPFGVWVSLLCRFPFGVWVALLCRFPFGVWVSFLCRFPFGVFNEIVHGVFQNYWFNPSVIVCFSKRRSFAWSPSQL